MSKGKLAAAPQLLFVVNNRSDFLSILIQIFFHDYSGHLPQFFLL